MHALGRMFAVVTLTAAGLAATMVEGQPPFQPGGFGKKGPNDYFSLVQNGQVKDELKITDEQLAKLPPAALKALAEVLDAKQLKRLKEMYLQTRGNPVYLEADVKKDLKITDEQAKKIKDAIDKQAKEQTEMFQSGDFDFEKMQELQRTTTETVQSVLTAAQKSEWSKLIGEPFELKGKKKGDY
jgi:Spy/CpxP family protein refolding chaperone